MGGTLPLYLAGFSAGLYFLIGKKPKRTVTKLGKRFKIFAYIGIIVFVMASTGGAAKTVIHTFHGGGHVTAGGDLNTPSGWAKAFLSAAHLPLTRCNYNAMREWEAHEGGGFGNQASYNPLNVNPPPNVGWPGHHVIGAWAFPDAQTGLNYSIQTLYNGYYGGIIAAFRRGDSAQADVNAVQQSPWASSHYGYALVASC